MSAFVRDPNDWLRKLSPDEWIRAALGEVARAEAAYKARDIRAGVAGCKRAAGMALNAALIVEPNAGWGRTYVEHLSGLAKDADAPQGVRAAASIVEGARPPGTQLVPLRTPQANERVIEATKDVMAHAYAVVQRHAWE